MATRLPTTYSLDYAVPPGETLLETIEALEISQAELAERTGRPTKTINEIIKAKARITPDTALQLEHVLGIPASFWNNRERRYREILARNEENEKLRSQIGWLKDLPVRAMVNLEWINGSKDKVEQVRELLRFFGVASRDQWQAIWTCERARFRKSAAFKSDPGALSAWLRKGELDAQAIACEPFDVGKFRSSLWEIRRLTVEPAEEFVPHLSHLCAASGVAVVFVPELPKTRTSGATRWLSPTKALIQLSLRYRTDDHLWFTFFHEAGHIIRHSKKAIFLERAFAREAKVEEEEANQFAQEMLTPMQEYRRFLVAGLFTDDTIIDFAKGIGIAPGIVVGRLQHDDYLPHSHCNELKRRFEWA